jgi:hypothetical protein
MRQLPGYLIAFVLAALLASTTPAGTGAGVHQFDLLHPLFSHVHLINGRIVTHEQMAQASFSAPTPAPVPGTTAFGANQGSAAGDGGLGVSPTVPGELVATLWDGTPSWLRFESLMPHGLDATPPDPPPL